MVFLVSVVVCCWLGWLGCLAWLAWLGWRASAVGRQLVVAGAGVVLVGRRMC